jgi:hypothetical protein
VRIIDNGQATGKLYDLRLRVGVHPFVIYKVGRALNTKNLSIKYYGRVGPLPKLRKFKNIDLLTTSLVVFEAKDNACPMIECMVFLHQ